MLTGDNRLTAEYIGETVGGRSCDCRSAAK